MGEDSRRLHELQNKNVIGLNNLSIKLEEAEKDHARIRAEMLKGQELLQAEALRETALARADALRETALIKADVLEKFGPMKDYFWDKGKPSIEWVIEYRKTLKTMAISLTTAAILSICGVFLSLYVIQQQNIAVQAALREIQRGVK
jgi:hypothetical protein